MFIFKNRPIGGGMSPLSSRHVIQNQKSELAGSSNGLLANSFNVREINSSSPIRLNVYRLEFKIIILFIDYFKINSSL